MWTEGVLRFADVHDGLSNTVMFSEVLDDLPLTSDPRRGIWYTPLADGPDELDLFAQRCREAPDQGGRRSSYGRGWVNTPVSYNHILTPNSPSCFNGPRARGMTGAWTAGSEHPAGIHSLFADGSVRFVGDSIGVDLWRAVASRNGGEAITPP